MPCLYVSNKTKDLKLNVFNMISGINYSKILIKHISCGCNAVGRKYNSDQWWNNNKCPCESKKRHVCEQDYAWNPATCKCENGKYLASIIDNWKIRCDEIIESYGQDTKTIPTNFSGKKATLKSKILIFYLHFIDYDRLLIAASIYCYFIKYRAKQLLPFHYTNHELRVVLY